MSLLSVGLGFLALASLLSAGLLVAAARRKPRIGALTERASLAVLQAVFGAVCVVLVWNTDSGQLFFPIELARVIFRACLFINLLVPPAWLVLYFTGRLGGDEAAFIEADRERIDGAIEEIGLTPIQLDAVRAAIWERAA